MAETIEILEQRFQSLKAAGYDRLALLWCGGLFAATFLFIGMSGIGEAGGLGKSLVGDVLASTGLACMMAFLPMYAFFRWTARDRSVRAAIVPQLAVSLAPLGPTRAELSDALAGLTKNGTAVAKILDPDRILAEVAKVPRRTGPGSHSASVLEPAGAGSWRVPLGVVGAFTLLVLPLLRFQPAPADSTPLRLPTYLQKKTRPPARPGASPRAKPRVSPDGVRLLNELESDFGRGSVPGPDATPMGPPPAFAR